MAIEVKEENGILQIMGSLSSQNVLLIKNHLENLFQVKKKLMVSLENVSSIEPSAARSLERYYTEAASNNKILLLFGLQNLNISETMQNTGTHYILNSDRA